MSILFNTKWRRAWSIIAAIITVACLGGDALLRLSGSEITLAPTAISLWVTVAAGLLLGLTGALWERYVLIHHRQAHLEFNRVSLYNRMTWKYQSANVQENGWFLLLMLVLFGACFFARVFVLPAVFAASAIFGTMNSRIIAEFHTELCTETEQSTEKG